MGVLDHLSNVRYTRAVELYAQQLGRANTFRSGLWGLSSVLARAAGHAESTPATPAPPGAGGGQGGTGAGGGGAGAGGHGGRGVLATVGRGVQAAIGFEQRATAIFGKVPFPSLPALRTLDIDVGLPHAHNHPPNLTPPNPVPIPLPSTGPILSIPILSGATTVLINGRPAARCGDMGAGVWCGGFFPFYEIFLGSSSVWIEGARAGRLAVDVTKHCTFSSPKPSDPPKGPMVGTTVAMGSPNVLIGGMPLPSLFSMAMAQAFKLVFRVGGLVLRRLTARSYIQKLIRTGRLTLSHGPPGWADDVTRDLERIARTRAGRQLLGRIQKSGRNVTIHPYSGWTPPTPTQPSVWMPHNAFAWSHTADGVMDIPTGLRMAGSDAGVVHTPAFWGNHPSGGMPGAPARTTSDAILFHELNHAANATEGAMRGEGTVAAHQWNRRWKDFEEYSTVAAENGYRREMGLPQRDMYGPFP